MTRVRDDALLQAFAIVLRDLRRELALSQEQLALRAGVDRTFVGKLESGRHQPSLAVVFKLAQSAGTTPVELIARVQQVLLSGVKQPTDE
jgi:transcriptional regulator with XRE-family HTH domain